MSVGWRRMEFNAVSKITGCVMFLIFQGKLSIFCGRWTTEIHISLLFPSHSSLHSPFQPPLHLILKQRQNYGENRAVRLAAKA